MFLSFNHGKKIDLTMLREGIDIGDDNFFKNYDKNNNSIFDADELAQLQEDLTNAAGEDLVLSDEIEQGDTVVHAKYGNGVVEKMIKYGTKTLFSINFDNVGRRLLDPTLTEIKKA